MIVALVCVIVLCLIIGIAVWAIEYSIHHKVKERAADLHAVDAAVGEKNTIIPFTPNPYPVTPNYDRPTTYHTWDGQQVFPSVPVAEVNSGNRNTELPRRESLHPHGSDDNMLAEFARDVAIEVAAETVVEAVSSSLESSSFDSSSDSYSGGGGDFGGGGSGGDW